MLKELQWTLLQQRTILKHLLEAPQNLLQKEPPWPFSRGFVFEPADSEAPSAQRLSETFQ
jgi:hypothetical protein